MYRSRTGICIAGNFTLLLDTSQSLVNRHVIDYSFPVDEKTEPRDLSPPYLMPAEVETKPWRRIMADVTFNFPQDDHQVILRDDLVCLRPGVCLNEAIVNAYGKLCREGRLCWERSFSSGPSNLPVILSTFFWKWLSQKCYECATEILWKAFVNTRFSPTTWPSF